MDEVYPEFWGAIPGFLLITWSPELFFVDNISIKLMKKKFGEKLYTKMKKLPDGNMLHSNCLFFLLLGWQLPILLRKKVNVCFKQPKRIWNLARKTAISKLSY